MAGLITRKTGEEGEIFNKWLRSRLIDRNKNVISAELGATGSGKSYRDLRKMELWYKYYFKQSVPLENICFGLGQIMKRLSESNLRKGEVLVLEEAGVNLGSREWQNKYSKMFNYILQSFRSMNIGVFVNLPYLSMLDSQARHLLHYYAESVGIDYKEGVNKCKPFFIQVAQSTGKIYRHYPIVKIEGRSIKVKRFNYKMPSKYIIDAYEEKKQAYLKELIKGFSDKANGKEKEKRPSELAFKCYDKAEKEKKTHTRIGEELGISQVHVSRLIKQVKKWLESSENKENKGDVVFIKHTNPLQNPSNLNLISTK